MIRIRNLSMATAMCGLLCFYASARTLLVGPGQTYVKPSLAAAVVNAGDTVQIDPGTYESDACTWRADNLVLRAGPPGSKQRAHLKSNGANAQGKGIWVIDGKNILVENIEFSGAKVEDENGAGIRQQAAGATIRNCYFHDNENGILGIGTDMVVEYTEFARNGVGGVGQTHNIYVDAGTSFTMRYCYTHRAIIGHNLKSRAEKNFIMYNRIMDGAEGTSSYDIDLPEGGVAVIVGNLIQQGPETDNSTIVAYGAEGIKHKVNEIYLVSNTLVNDRDGGVFVSIAGSPSVSRAYGNLFAGKGTVFSGAPKDTSGNVFTQDPGFVDRAGFDYRLNAGSPAIDKLTKDPGTGAGISLAATFEYADPLGAAERVNIGAADAGALEFKTGSAIRGGKRTGARTGKPALLVGNTVYRNSGLAEDIRLYNGLGAVVRIQTGKVE